MHPPDPLSIKNPTSEGEGKGGRGAKGKEGGERGGKESEGEGKWYPSYPHFLGESYPPRTQHLK